MLFGGFEIGRNVVCLLHLRADDEHLPPLADELVDEGVEPRSVALVHAHGLHRLAAGRQLVDDRHVQIAVHQQRQCARDGRRAHDERVRLLALAHKRGALLDAEAVLLVRDDETETEKRHRVADERVRADDDVEQTAGERLFYFTLLPRGHCARQPADADAERLEQCTQRVFMLLGEDLRRRHEGALAVIFVHKPDARRGDERLARADVALHKAAHRHAGDHILHGGGDGAPLRPGGREGERAVKCLEVGGFHTDAALGAPLRADARHGGREHEQLLEHQPLARRVERLRIGRLVDVLQGIVLLCEVIGARDVRRDHVLQLPDAGVQRGRHGLADVVLRHAGRQRVDRVKAVGHAAAARRLLADGVRHRLAKAVGFHLAVENVRFARVQIVFAVGLVEVGHVQCAGIVCDAHLDERESAADILRARLGRDRGADAHGLAGLCVRDRAKLRPVLVPAGV